MACEICKSNLKNEIIGLIYFASKNINALPGRLRGFRNNAHSTTIERNHEAVQHFGGKLGTDKDGIADVVYDDLGDRALSDSLKLNVAVSVRRNDGSSSVAKMQLRHYNDGARKGIVGLKDSDNVAYLVLNGKDVTDGIGIAISTRNGVGINSISRLLPDMTDDQIMHLFKLIADKQGALVNLATDDKGVLYKGVKNVSLDLESAEFVDMLNVARGIEKRVAVERKLDVRILPVAKGREILTPLILTRTVPVSDFKTERLRDFVVAAQGKSKESRVVETKREPKGSKAVEETRHYQIEQEGQRRETAADFLQDFIVVAQGKTEQVAGNIVDEVTNKHEEDVLGKTEKVQPIQIERIRVKVRPKIGMKISISGEELINILERPEALFQLKEEGREVKHKQNVRKKEATEPAEITDKENDVTAVVKQEVLQETGARGVEVQERKGELSEDRQMEENEEVVLLADVVERVVVSGAEAVLSTDEEIEEEVLVNSGDGVVDYGRGEVTLMTEVKSETAEERGVFEDVVIFDARKLVLKKPLIFGEVIISEALFKNRRKVFKIPKKYFRNQMFPDELFDIESGQRMLLDTSFNSGQIPSYLTIIVPAILFWIEDLSLTLN